MYALELDSNNKILLAVFDRYGTPNMPRVDTLPDGDISEYRYVDGEYIYDPLPTISEPELEPTVDDILNTLLGVN